MQLQPLGEAVETGSGVSGSPGPRAKQCLGIAGCRGLGGREGATCTSREMCQSAGVALKVPVPGTNVQRSVAWSNSLAPPLRVTHSRGCPEHIHRFGSGLNHS